MLLSKIDENKLNDKIINKILFDIPKDDKLKGDCIWVFGSIRDIDERLNLAIKLYKDKRAPYILFTGGKGKYGVTPEATIMKEKALEMGIPEEAIISEEESFNTTENVLCSMITLERKFLLKNINRLIIVSSEFHIRRIMLTISKYMPKWIKFSYCYDENISISKNNWIKTDESRRRIEKEAKGIIFYAKNNYIDDINIQLK